MDSIYKKPSWVFVKSKNDLANILLIGAYIVTLILAYYFVLSPMYSYSLLTFDPNIYKIIFGILLILVSMLLSPKDTEKPSTFLYFIFYTTTFVPTAVYYGLNDQPTAYISFLTICFIMISLMLRKPVRGIATDTNKTSIFIKLLILAYFMLCLYVVLKNGGIHFRAIFADLYLARSRNNLSGVTGYILNWCAKAFTPLLIAYFYAKKKWIWVGVVCAFQVLLFISFGFKAFLMAIVLLIGVCFLMGKPENFRRNWLLVLVLGNIVCIAAAFTVTKTPINLFTYRTLFLPSQGQFEYYDFFTHHDFLYFSEGSIGQLLDIDYPYSQTIGRIVNLYIYGPSKISNGNTGAMAYGFADLGFMGMILASLVIGIILAVADSVSRNINVMIPVGAMAYQIYALNDNNVLICINTGGIFITILLLFILNSSNTGRLGIYRRAYDSYS